MESRAGDASHCGLGGADLVVESCWNYSKSPSKLVEGWGVCRSLSKCVKGRHKSFEDDSSQDLVLKVPLGLEVLSW